MYRINRNIVECKLIWNSVIGEIEHRINRNIVECKYNDSSGALSVIGELIETLWNVNEEWGRRMASELRN